MSLEDSALWWEALAKSARRMAEHDRKVGVDLSTPGQSPGDHRAKAYEATAKAIRLEAQTGVAHCSCCLKPTGQHRNK